MTDTTISFNEQTITLILAKTGTRKTGELNGKPVQYTHMLQNVGKANWNTVYLQPADFVAEAKRGQFRNEAQIGQAATAAQALFAKRRGTNPYGYRRS